MINDEQILVRREARRRALRAAAAVAVVGVFGGCASTVEGLPTRAELPTGDDAGVLVDVAAVGDVGAAVDVARGVEAHPPANDGGVARDGATVDAGPPSACAACNELLEPGEWPGCTSEYLTCLREVAARTGEQCQWGCAAWGPFNPPAFEV